MKIAASVGWVAISRFTLMCTQAVSLAVLTRLLTPADYGLMALALVATNLAMLLKDLGTSASIIQRPEITDSVISAISALNLMVGIFIFIIFLLIAGPIAMWFSAPKLESVLIFLSIIFPVASLGATDQALLERNSRFDLIARIEISGAIIALFSAVLVAYMGFGVYSLALQQVTNAVVCTCLLKKFNKDRVGYKFSAVEIKEIYGFASNLSVFNLITYFSRNVDAMLIGKRLGAVELGNYSLAYRLMFLPLQTVSFVAQRALFPSISRAQNDIGAVRLIFLRGIYVITSIVCPAMLILLVHRDYLIGLVFGAGWTGVGKILIWLIPVAIIQSVTNTGGVLMMGLGKARLLVLVGCLGAGLNIVSFLIGIRWGAVGVAKCYLVANVIYISIIVVIFSRLLEMKVVEFVKMLLPISIISVVAVYLGYRLAMSLIDAVGAASFILAITIAAAIYIVLWYLMPGSKQFINLISEARTRRGTNLGR